MSNFLQSGEILTLVCHLNPIRCPLRPIPGLDYQKSREQYFCQWKFRAYPNRLNKKSICTAQLSTRDTHRASPLPAAIATILCCLLLAAQFLVPNLLFKDVWQIYLKIRPPSGNVGLLHRRGRCALYPWSIFLLSGYHRFRLTLHSNPGIEIPEITAIICFLLVCPWWKD